MTLEQSLFFPSGDLPIVNSRLSQPGDERKTTTTGEEEEEKEDRTGGGVGSIDASTIGTVETQRARVRGVRDPRRVRCQSLLRSRRQGVLNRRSRRRRLIVIGHGIGGKDIPIMARLAKGQMLE
jgi:hypothetical protein